MVIGNNADFFLTTFSLLYLASAGMFFWILGLVRHIRKNRVILPFRILLILFILWCVCYSLYFLNDSVTLWIVIEQAAYVSYSLITVFLFIVAWQYSSEKDIFRCKWTPLLFVIPAITILLAWIPGYQSMLMHDFYINYSGPIPVLEYEYGVWGFVHIGNNLILGIGSLILFLHSLLIHQKYHRAGTLMMITGLTIYAVWNMGFFCGIMPLWVYYLPVFLIAISIFLGLGIIRYNLLEFLPMARSVVLEQISDLFLILSVDSYVVDLNPSMAQTFNLDRTTAPGRAMSDLFVHHPEFIQICMNPEGVQNVFSLEKEGTTFNYLVRRSQITDREGQNIGTVLILHDITELASTQKKLAASINELLTINHTLTEEIQERKRAEDTLSLANKKLNLLSAITRHDILNSLTALKGYLRFIKDDHPDITYLDQCYEFANMIESNIMFTRVYDEIGINRPSWQNLFKLIETAISEFSDSNLAFHVDTEQIHVYADPLFAKVLNTLIDNTRRHAETATRVTIRTKTGESLVIVFEDNGVGIPVGEKEKIFNRGYGKNTGLGLFISRDILAITGIAIRETGEPGVGARFEIEVPPDSWRSGSS